MQALRCKAKNNRVEHKSCFKCAVSVPLWRVNLARLLDSSPLLSSSHPTNRLAPPATELLSDAKSSAGCAPPPGTEHPLPGPGAGVWAALRAAKSCEGTINFKKQQGITLDLRIGCLGKDTPGMSDNETDPAPLKLEKASRKQSPKPTLQRINKNVYIEKG